MKWKRIYAESETEDFFEKYNEDIKNIVEDYLEGIGIENATYTIKDWKRQEGTISSDVGEYPIMVGELYESVPGTSSGYWRDDRKSGKILLCRAQLPPKKGDYVSQGYAKPVSFTDNEEAFKDFVDKVEKSLPKLKRLIQDFKNELDRSN